MQLKWKLMWWPHVYSVAILKKEVWKSSVPCTIYEIARKKQLPSPRIGCTLRPIRASRRSTETASGYINIVQEFCAGVIK